MSGVVGTVGGWFASSIISKVIDAAASYLDNNYDLQRGTRDALTSLKISLPQILAAIEVASRRPITNRGLVTWLNDLKNAAYEAEDVLDDLEAKRSRESLKGKNKVVEIASSSGTIVKTLIFSDKELEGLKSAVQKLSEISKGVEPFVTLLKLEYSINIKTRHTDCYRSETSSNLDPNAKIFGRDEELNFILDMIFNCQLMLSTEGNSEPHESQPSPPSGGESYLPDPREVVETSSFRGNENGTIGKRKRFSGKSSEVGQEGKNEEVSNVKSIVSVQNSVCIRNWKLPVLPIFGLGGLGKTTIAKMVYNSIRVTEGFDLKAWVYVPENFDIRRIMCDIQFSLRGCSSVDTMMNLETIEWNLIETIKNKRLFLVLDGVHDGIESIWAGLLSVLSKGEPGSFVLVTTQSERVAKTIGNMPNIITLDVLGPECFMELFEYYAFGEFKLLHMEKQPHVLNLEEEKLRTLKMIATKIATKLHGLPLAGVVIGKMLHTRLEREYWEEIMKSNWWDDERAVEGILPSLGIGYMNLDPELKQCFAFCSIFPKHYVFSRNILVQMWMAHGFIQPNDNETYKLEIGEIRLEDLGSKRFEKLVDRSFFQATIFDGKFIMHDLIRDLAIAVSSNEFCYIESLDNYFPSIARHLAINCDGSNIEGISHGNTNLRTMILFGNWKNCTDESISNILGKSIGLRLLDLSYIGFKTAPIDAICQLSHIRFLDLSFSGIKLIPDKFCELWHLQVLDVRGCNFQQLPKDMNKLINLRHLYASVEIISLIFGIGKLTNLQELEKFRIEMSEGYRITELSDMNEIRGNLTLINLQNVSSEEEACASQLTKKKHLKSLELRYLSNKGQSTTKKELEVLEALKPSPNIEMLTIQGCRAEYPPSWISAQNDVPNLKCIKVRTFIKLTTFPAFGELPSLEILCLYDLPGIKKVGDEFYGCSNVLFPSLKELAFTGLSCWREWSDPPAGKTSFPQLKKIHIEYCQELMEMPTNIFTSSILELKLLVCPNIHNIETVLQGIPSLSQLSISRCHKDLSIHCNALISLEVMSIRNVDHLCFVGGLKSLVNLKRLIVSKIGEFLESFEVEQENDGTYQENQMHCLQFLNFLQLGDRYGGTQCLSTVGRVPSLRTLLICQFPAEEYTREEEILFLQLTSLEELIFYDCLKLRHLPSTLPMLSSLKKLTIVFCQSISSLPEAGLPQNLISLCIGSCSDELVQRCQPNIGDDWHKISHIPQVRITTRIENYYNIDNF